MCGRASALDTRGVSTPPVSLSFYPPHAPAGTGILSLSRGSSRPAHGEDSLGDATLAESARGGTLFPAFQACFFVIPGGPAATMILSSGFLTGYLLYDMLHYAMHHFNIKSGYVHKVRRNHMRHHALASLRPRRFIL